MNRLILIILLLSSLNCSIDRTIVEVSESENSRLINFQEIQEESRLIITDEQEPGEDLMLCLTLVEKETKEILPNQLMEFYHTSAAGNYEQVDPADESTARLSGQAITNEAGQIYVATILPGDYGSSPDRRHIHTTVFGTRPDPYDIHFKQYTTYMGKRFTNRSSHHFLAELKRTANNQLVCFVTMEVKDPAGE